MSKTSKSVAPESLLKDADYNKTSAFDKTHRQVKTLNDPRFGDIHILQNPQTRQVVAVRERKVTDKAEAGRLVLAARNRMALKNPYLVNLLDYSVTKQSELCSSFYIIKYYFEYPRTDLRKYLLEKEKSGQALSSAELTHLLYQQNAAQAYLQSQGMAHGDVQPLFIGWDPERLESKVIDKSEALTTDAAIINAQKNRLVAGQPLYMSPTMYANLKKGNTKFQFDRNKEDAFALGLLLLEAGNGRSIQNIYDSKTGQVNQAALNGHLEEFNRKYGAQNTLLTSHVSSMTNINEAARPSPSQIQASLPPYEEVKMRLVNSPADFGGAIAYGATGGAYGSNVESSTRTIQQGPDMKTIVTTVTQMPEVNEDLFAFDHVEAPVSARNVNVASWDPSLVAPKVVAVPPSRYEFERPKSRPGVESQVTGSYRTQTQPLYTETTTTTQTNDLFSTFGGGSRPAAARGAAKVESALVYGGDPNANWQQEQFVGASNFNRKQFGERIVGDAAGDAQAQLQASQAQINNEFQAANQQALATNVAQTQAQAQFGSQAQAPAIAPAQTTTTTTTTQYQVLNSSQPRIGDIIPTGMRRSVSASSHSSIQHEFRLYDSTLTIPEVVQGGSFKVPYGSTQSTISYESRPASQQVYTTVYDAPATTYSIASPSVVYQAAPASTYTTTYETVTRPSQIVYTQPTIVEAPVQTITYASAEPTITSYAPANSAKVITTRQSLVSEPQIAGLKFIGSYTDDSTATIKQY